MERGRTGDEMAVKVRERAEVDKVSSPSRVEYRSPELRQMQTWSLNPRTCLLASTSFWLWAMKEA